MTKRLYDPKISAKRIRDRRKELKMTQKDLSDKSGICLSAIKKYELGIRVPEGDYRQWLAQALEVYADWLVGGKYKTLADITQDMIKKITDLPGVKESVQQLEAFLQFTDSLGYSIVYEKDRIIIKCTDWQRSLNDDDFNRLYKEIICSVKARIDSAEDSSSFKIRTEPYIKIESSVDSDPVNYDDLRDDDLRKIFLDIRKGGDADDLN